MFFEKVTSEIVSHLSYFIGSGTEAVVVDPRRDCQVYVDIAKREEMNIRHIFETHRNEDYIIGSLELAGLTGAVIYTLTVSPDGWWTTSVQLWRLVIGGFLVGFGTRLSSGCTSGHGISGIASLSTTSLFAVITFILFGIISTQLIMFLEVLP
ncbi:YeeE/YedE family protein [Candidatus Bathyarchaeota archaeon]|nr:YeeE/YedE family protein [Candidatus Bathyarchaeota archaeon]